MAYCHKREVGCYIVVKKTPGEFAHRHHEVVKLYLIEAIIDSCKKKQKTELQSFRECSCIL